MRTAVLAAESLEGPAESTRGERARESESPVLAEGVAADKTAVLSPITRRQSHTPSLDDTALQGDATVVRAKTLRKHKKRLQRSVAAVAVVSALVAVVVSAFLVNALTGGQGIGAKVSPLPSAYTQNGPAGDVAAPSSDSSDSDTGSDEGNAASPDAGKDSGSDQSGSGSSGSADDGKTDGSSGSSGS